MKKLVFLNEKMSKEEFIENINKALESITTKLVILEEAQDKLNSAVMELAEGQDKDSESWFDNL